MTTPAQLIAPLYDTGTGKVIVGDGIIDLLSPTETFAVRSWMVANAGGGDVGSLGLTGTEAARLPLLSDPAWNTKEFLYFDEDNNVLMLYYPIAQAFIQYDGQKVGTNPPTLTPSEADVWVGLERIYTWDSTHLYWKIVVREYLRVLTVPNDGIIDEEIEANISAVTTIRFSETSSNVYKLSIFQQAGADKLHFAYSVNAVTTVYSPLITLNGEVTVDANMPEGVPIHIGVTLKFSGVQNGYDIFRFKDKVVIIGATSLVAPTSAFLTMSTSERSYLRASGSTSTKYLFDVTLQAAIIWKPAISGFIRNIGQRESNTGFPTTGLTNGQTYTSPATGIIYTYNLASDFWDCSLVGHTAWSAYTPTVGVVSGTPPTMTGSTLSGTYEVVGKTMFLKFLTTGNAAGNDGSGTYTWSLPSGYTIDTTACQIDAAVSAGQGNNVRFNSHSLGYGDSNTNGVPNQASAYAASSTTFVIATGLSGSLKLFGSSQGGVTTPTTTTSLNLVIPIL